ncbi:MAG: T9SS type A sorting domain-containing protein [Rhodothermales bacterium]|nr:T9SS type A sorting domain-containing protein [Rhodothermales bacterium]
MKYLVIGLLFVSSTVAAQQNQVVSMQPMEQSERVLDRATPLEVTTSLLMSEEGKEALAEFERMKAAGEVPGFNKNQRTYEVGATTLFWVRNVSTNAFEQRDFTLQHDDTNFAIWAETSEVTNGNVRAQDVEDVRAAMKESTPADSYNPSQGIIDNDIEIFGAPPDFDGDGKTDLLLVDVRDDYDPDSGNFLFVAGFFDPNDLTMGSQSNQADIIYMDTMPGMVNESGTRRPIENLLQTTAHEFQHLIHANYDGNEDIWVNEAQSEWAEIELGYPGRTITYLSDVDEHDTEMFAFRSGSILELLDRERGAIVSKFFAEQLGVLVQGSVTRETSNSEDGYIDTFGSEEAFRDVVLDYHTAVRFNDQSFSSRFGFSDQRFDDLTTPVDRSFDGRTASSTSLRDSVVSGGVVYIRWDFVEDFNYSFDVEGPAPFIEAYRDRVPTRLVFEDESGIVSFSDVRGDGTNNNFPGVFRTVTAIVGQSKPGASGAAFDVEASWMGGSSSTVEEVNYDSGTTSGDYFSGGANANNAMATGFAVPAGNTVSLDKVRLTNYYENMFAGGIPTDPRDFILKVWDVTDGKPGGEIFSLELDDPRAYSGVFDNNYDFFELDLSPFAGQLDNLPDSIAVGITEAGTDVNYMVHAPFMFASSANISWIILGATWADVWDLTLTDGGGNETPLDGFALPVQVSFLIQSGPTAIEDDDVLPGTLTLDQNYPNPFNPQTTIDFTLPTSGNVDLGVFDLLGRRVATLATGLTPAGSHQVAFDGSRFASGVYVYRLESDTKSLTRTMLLLK